MADATAGPKPAGVTTMPPPALSEKNEDRQVMFERQGAQFNWKQSEWTAFGWLFCLFMIYPLMNGYPFIYPDSWGYAGGICPDSIRSPVLGCAMRPISVILGTWGYVIVQSGVTAFILMFLSAAVLKRPNSRALFTAAVIAGVGLFAGLILADIWTLTALVCLFSIGMGFRSKVTVALLAVSISTHYGNFPVVAATAFLFLPFTVGRLKYAGLTVAAVLGAAILIVAANMFGSELRFSPRLTGFVTLSSRIMHDIPEVIVKKCTDEPGFKLCEIKDDIVAFSRSRDQQQMTWLGKDKMKISWEELDGLGREIVIYSLREFPLENLHASIKNTLANFSRYGLSGAITIINPSGWEVEGLKKYFPNEFQEFDLSWQAKGISHNLCKKLEVPLSRLFALASLVCLAYIAAKWKNRRSDPLVNMSIFGMIAVVTNAILMSNLSGAYGRYHTRIGFLIIFPACCIVFQLAGDIYDRIHRMQLARQNNGSLPL